MHQLYIVIFLMTISEAKKYCVCGVSIIHVDMSVCMLSPVIWSPE